MTPELIVISEPSPLISSSAQLDENVTVAASTSEHAFEFEYVPEYPEKFVLRFYTNNGVIGGISESSWKFLDQDGNILESLHSPYTLQLLRSLNHLLYCFLQLK